MKKEFHSLKKQCEGLRNGWREILYCLNGISSLIQIEGIFFPKNHLTPSAGDTGGVCAGYSDLGCDNRSVFCDRVLLQSSGCQWVHVLRSHPGKKAWHRGDNVHWRLWASFQGSSSISESDWVWGSGRCRIACSDKTVKQPTNVCPDFCTRAET